MNDIAVLRFGEPLRVVAEQYASTLQQMMLNKGSFRSLLDIYRQGDFIKSSLQIAFSPASNGFSFPTFELQFDYYYNQQAQGFWGIVPALAIEAFGENEEALAEHLEETIRLEFDAQRRLSYVQNIVSAIWYHPIELQQHPLAINLLRPAEIEQIGQNKAHSLLEKIVQALEPAQQEMYGRLNELEQLARAMKGRFSRNVLLVGPSGVGKTALVNEVAWQHKKYKIKGRILETTASVMIKELMTEDASWQYNLPLLCRELAGSEDFLFVRNLAELFEVGKYEGNEISIADYLLPFISRSEINLISECTAEELARIELKSPTYLSHFQIIRLEEPAEEELEFIVLQKIRDSARAKKIAIEDEAIREAIRLYRRFAPYSGMPGRPIRFLEASLLREKTSTSQSHIISRSDIIRYFCEESGMPPFIVDPEIPMDGRSVINHFNGNVFGQQPAVSVLANVLAGVKTALSKTGKPIASLLFVGPTGVGKTEVAKVLAAFMFGSRDRIVRFDMSEYSDYRAVSRLIGNGAHSDGELTSAVRREPFCVLLFDEIEKADAGFFDLLLQILGEGRLSDSRGKVVNFCSAIIIMTSNIGAARFQMGRVRLQTNIEKEEAITHFSNEAQQYFRPELFNRIDELVPFVPLDLGSVRFVVEREIELLRKREGIRFRRMSLKIDPTVLDHLGREGYDEKYGARYLQRVIREQLVLPLARQLNEEDLAERLDVSVDMNGNLPAIHIERDPMALDLMLEELEKANYANYAGSLRRKIQRVLSGYLFNNMLSEIYKAERMAEKHSEKSNHLIFKLHKYHERFEIVNAGKELKVRIEAMELELSVAVLGIEAYQPGIVKAIETWEADFFEWKKSLYAFSAPRSCFVCIYGAQPIEPALFYKSLFEHFGFSFHPAAIWFRRPSHKAVKASSDGFIVESLENKGLEELEPENKDDLLYGMSFHVQGPCVGLYLEQEGGLQRWVDKDGKEHRYIVKISDQPQPIPATIHRQDFYAKENPRRVLSDNVIKDSILNINRQYQRDEWKQILFTSLENYFKNRLDEEVL